LTRDGSGLAFRPDDHMSQAGIGVARRDRDDGAVLAKFRYGLDPVCLAAIGAYGVTRWIYHPDFLRGWFHDVLLLPAALPIFLWFERRLGMRGDDDFPRTREIVFYWITWSVACEVAGPAIFPWATGDWRDVLWYGAGGVLCHVVWSTCGPGSRHRGARGRWKVSWR
jgi:hypothetical protein